MLINRYIAKQICFKTTNITIIIGLTIVMLESLRYLELIIDRSISISNFLLLLLYLLPQYIATILPFSFFIGVLLTYSSMKRNKELVILQNSGLSYFALLKPVVTTSIIITLFTLLLHTTIVPTGWYNTKKTLSNTNDNNIAKTIPTGRFFSPSNNATIFIKRKKGLRIYDILIFRTTNDKNLEILTAKKGAVLWGKNTTKIVLYNGFQQSGTRNALNTVRFEKYLFSIPLTAKQLQQKSHYRDYTSLEIYNHMKNNTATYKQRVDFFVRIINSITVIITGFIASIVVLLSPTQRVISSRSTVIATTIMIVTMVPIVITTQKAYSNIFLLYYSAITIAIILSILCMTIVYKSKRV